MTVTELIALLQEFPPHLEVICSRYSDYQALTPSEVTLQMGVKKNGGEYIMRNHATLPPAERAKLEPFVHFEGN